MFELEGKNVVVLGLAKSGTTIAKILHRMKAKVVVNDAKSEEKCPEKEMLERLGIKVICGTHPENLVNEQVDLVVKNPGIPYTISPIQQAIALNIPVITEVELAYQYAKAPIIGITGSNGKTTTTTLIGEILEEGEKSPIVAGNIGTVLSEKALEATSDQVLVTELSSFQLKGTITFRPQIAILLNIYPAHLDYHQELDDYIKSKFNIFKNQSKDDFAILNAECDSCLELLPSITSQVYLFSTKNSVTRGAFIEDGKIVWVEGDKKIEILSTHDLFLKGAHLENALAALIAAHLYGVDFGTIKKVLLRFKGVEHRLEFVLKTNAGVSFYNDSKSTNPIATITALYSFDKPLILIAGGLDRGIDFEELMKPFQEKVKILIVYGQSANKLLKIAEVSGIQQTFTVDNVNDAVKKGHALAETGDVVLLSPACASWDMFSSFEERGSMFKEAVHRLI